MEFCRIGDFELVREMFTHPDVYDSIGDDDAPPVEEFQVNRDDRIWYVAAHDYGSYGMFTLIPQNRVCWEVHVVMSPLASTRFKWDAARALPGWLRENTECRRLVAAVPANNGPAIIYGTHGIGLHYVGRHGKAFMKGGKLQDLVLLGLSISDKEV